MNDANGFNENQLKTNLDLAADVYISRVQGAPCGEANNDFLRGFLFIISFNVFHVVLMLVLVDSNLSS